MASSVSSSGTSSAGVPKKSSIDDEGTPPKVGEKFTVAAEMVDTRFQDNYDMEGDNEDAYSLSEKIVHYLGGYICPHHWTSIKAAIVFKAGSSVSELPPMSKAAKEAKTLETYLEIVNDLDPLSFPDDMKAFLSGSFCAKDKGIQEGANLYRYYLDSRCKMRSLIIPRLPVNFASMQSGKSFHNTCNDVMLQHYRKELVQKLTQHTKEEAAQVVLRSHHEFRKSPWIYLLAVKIFRTNPQLAPSVVELVQNWG